LERQPADANQISVTAAGVAEAIDVLEALGSEPFN
jgi:hypothetical protein